MTKLLKLRNGDLVTVDDFDYEHLIKFDWTAHSEGYAHAWIDGRMQLMHRVIMQADSRPELEVDHVDQNKANNKRENLRLVTRSQNKRNQTEIRTLVRGVELRNIRYVPGLGYQVRFTRRPKQVHVGTFWTLKEAQNARDAWIAAHP